MTPEQAELVRYRLSRAREALDSAEALAGRGDRFGATNRVYYACFYAVTALLLSEGFTSHKHRGVVSLFDQHWVKTGRLPHAMSRFYHAALDQRLRSDYDDLVVLEQQTVEAWLAEARKFVETIAAMLQAAQ